MPPPRATAQAKGVLIMRVQRIMLAAVVGLALANAVQGQWLIAVALALLAVTVGLRLRVWR